MKTYYYPGCTLPNNAKDFDISARACCKALGIELTEMEKWVCCGSAFKLEHENVMMHLGAIRNLVEIHKNGGRAMTLCVFCYNSLKRANNLFRKETDKHKIINEFLESDYDGSVQIVHLLEILRNEVGFDLIKAKVKKALTGLKVAPFYGCLLLRPFEEIGLDNPEKPTIFEDLFTSMGAHIVEFPFRLECCGSYLSVRDPEQVKRSVGKILESAEKAGANAVITSCPMCNYNFEFFGGDVIEGNRVHIFYFTELMALALGADLELCGLKQHQTDVHDFLFGRSGVYGSKEAMSQSRDNT